MLRSAVPAAVGVRLASVETCILVHAVHDLQHVLLNTVSGLQCTGAANEAVQHDARCSKPMLFLFSFFALAGPKLAGPAAMMNSGRRVQLARPSVAGLKVNTEHRVSGIREGRTVGICRLAARPFVYLLRGFLTAEECDYLMRRAVFEGWETAETEGSERVSAAARTACDVSYLTDDDSVVAEITQSAAEFVFGDEIWAREEELGLEIEELHVLRYSSGGEYKVHWDASWEVPRAASLIVRTMEVEPACLTIAP